MSSLRRFRLRSDACRQISLDRYGAWARLPVSGCNVQSNRDNWANVFISSLAEPVFCGNDLDVTMQHLSRHSYSQMQSVRGVHAKFSAPALTTLSVTPFERKFVTLRFSWKSATCAAGRGSLLLTPRRFPATYSSRKTFNGRAIDGLKRLRYRYMQSK
jgi:hypothetical protein